MAQAIALSPQLQKYAGKILDVDSHEATPAQVWEEMFGPEVRPFVEAWTVKGVTVENENNHPNIPDYKGDILPIDANIVNVKGRGAPGSGDAKRRLQVMDAMGVDKQLMFPGLGSFALQLAISGDNPNFLSAIKGDRVGTAKRVCDVVNDWNVGVAKLSSRIRPVASVYGETVDELYNNTKSLIDRGIRAIWLASPTPPGGRSPAHPDLDRYWAMLAEANCTVTLHLGTELVRETFASDEWRNAPPFQGHMAMDEFRLDPWSLSVVHLPCQNFITTMISGGVFVRHPKLRVGVIEVGCYWVGPMIECLDLWYSNLGVFNKNVHRLPEKPSTYLKSNVRVSSFPFENVAKYMERYDLEDVICFATDYPHVEGGKDVFNKMYANLERLGPKVMDKFFMDNGRLLLPD